MPSKTFYNLSQEKQQKIIDASKKEFSNNLYQDVSLNQIIKNSNISRGSFYMYFTDKEDLYFYLLNEYKANFEKVIIKTLNDNNGEIFSTFENLFTLLSHSDKYPAVLAENFDNIVDTLCCSSSEYLLAMISLTASNPTLYDSSFTYLRASFILSRAGKSWLRRSSENLIAKVLAVCLSYLICSTVLSSILGTWWESI